MGDGSGEDAARDADGDDAREREAVPHDAVADHLQGGRRELALDVDLEAQGRASLPRLRQIQLH
eukprot:4188385-Pyramimonas_sp.AAC.2